MTELGWSTDISSCTSGTWAGTKAQGVDPAQQAAFLTQAYQCMAADPYLAVAIWFSIGDGVAGENNFYGLADTSWTPKLSWAAFLGVAHSPAMPDKNCGLQVDTTPPTLTVSNPSEGQKVPSDLPITVTATDSQAIVSVKLYCDNKPMTTFTPSGGTNSELTGKIDFQHIKYLKPGRHKITVVAKDVGGNVTTKVIRVIKTTRSTKVATRTSLRVTIRGVMTWVNVNVTTRHTKNQVKGKVMVNVSRYVPRTAKKAGHYVSYRNYSGTASHFSLRLRLPKGRWRFVASYKAYEPYLASHSSATVAQIGRAHV